MADYLGLYEAVLDDDTKTAVAVTRQALADLSDLLELITNYMVPAMDEVGRRFEWEQ